MNLCELPREIQNQIFDYCETLDILNLSCSNSLWEEDLRSLLWRSVAIPCRSLLTRNFKLFGEDSLVEKLKHTESLRLFDNLASSKSRRKRINCYRKYKQLLKFCDSSNLHSFTIEGVLADNKTLELLQRNFHNLQQLHIVGVWNETRLFPETLTNLFTNFCLTELSLDCVDLDDNILRILGKHLSKLKVLNIQRNSDITDTGLATLSGLQLTKLVLNECPLITDKGVTAICRIKTLKKLYLYYCNVADEGIFDLSTLPCLHSLDLACTNVSDNGIILLSQLHLLENLELSECVLLTDFCLLRLSEMTSLRRIHLFHCNLTDTGLSYVCSLPHLQILDIGYTFVTDAGLRNLRKLKELREFYIHGCKFLSDQGVLEVVTLVKLTKLDLGCLNITDVGILYISEMTKLEDVTLCGCQYLTDTSMGYLRHLSRLKRLDIRATDISNLGLTHLTQVDSLRCVSLSGSKVTEAGIKIARDRFKLEEGD